jgi:hypothetical protein
MKVLLKGKGLIKNIYMFCQDIENLPKVKMISSKCINVLFRWMFNQETIK